MKLTNLAICFSVATLLGGGLHQAQAQTIPSSKIENSVFTLTMPSGWMALSSSGMPGMPVGSDSSGYAIHTTLGVVFIRLFPYTLDVDPTDIPDDAADQIPSNGTVQQISTGTKALGQHYTWNVTQYEWTDENGDKYRTNVYFCKVKNDAYITLVATPTEPTTDITALVAAAETGLATLGVIGPGVSIHQSFAMVHLKRAPQAGRAHDALGRNVAILPKSSHISSHFSRQFMRP